MNLLKWCWITILTGSLICANLPAFAQSGEEHPEGKVTESEKAPKHEDLETELELYPFNIIVPGDPVIKNEVMFDYHRFLMNDKLVYGVRFFGDANTHWAKMRDMKDLILYTEFYYGFRNFQLGAETGSVSGQEYLSIGPQFTNYDSKLFKRISIISRVLPDYALGYEFTTQEAQLTEGIKVSSTGMGRTVLPTGQTVIQASLWTSFKALKGMYFGVEYEYNNAKSYNNWRFETRNELFFGIKAELH